MARMGPIQAKRKGAPGRGDTPMQHIGWMGPIQGKGGRGGGRRRVTGSFSWVPSCWVSVQFRVREGVGRRERARESGG